MSNAIFPSLPGQAWPRVRETKYANEVQRSDSQRDWRVARALYPVYTITINYEYLSAADCVTLSSFFRARKGNFDTFLFDDRDDYLHSDAGSPQPFGEGDGETARFQLVRALGGVVEPIGKTNTITAVRVDGVVTTAYTVDDWGFITFTSAPAEGAVLDWAGTFYWRCAFLKPALKVNEFMRQMYDAKTVEFETIKP
jgi:uncharacterized protein (TIGR02217 family)